MSKNDIHEKQNREFLHDIATPMTIMRLSLKRLEIILEAATTPEDIQKKQEIFKRFSGALEKLEELHANFKVVLHNRTEDDSSDNGNTKVS